MNEAEIRAGYRQVAEVAEQFGLVEPSARARQALRDLDGPLQLMVVGKGNFGKSSLLNRLLGSDAAPVSRRPMTWAVDRYLATPTLTAEYAVVHRRSAPDDPERMSIAAAEKLSGSLSDASDVRSDVYQIDWFRHLPWLPPGLCLVDTPGFAQDREEISRPEIQLFGAAGLQLKLDDPFLFFFHRSDVVFWCFKATRLEDGDTRRMLELHAEDREGLVGVLTFMDRVPSERWTEIEGTARDVYGEWVSEWVLSGADGSETAANAQAALRLRCSEISARAAEERALRHGQRLSALRREVGAHLSELVAVFEENIATRQCLLRDAKEVVRRESEALKKAALKEVEAEASGVRRSVERHWDACGGDVDRFGKGASRCVDGEKLNRRLGGHFERFGTQTKLALSARAGGSAWRGAALGGRKNRALALGMRFDLPDMKGGWEDARVPINVGEAAQAGLVAGAAAGIAGGLLLGPIGWAALGVGLLVNEALKKDEALRKARAVLNGRLSKLKTRLERHIDGLVARTDSACRKEIQRSFTRAMGGSIEEVLRRLSDTDRGRQLLEDGRVPVWVGLGTPAVARLAHDDESIRRLTSEDLASTAAAVVRHELVVGFDELSRAVSRITTYQTSLELGPGIAERVSTLEGILRDAASGLPEWLSPLVVLRGSFAPALREQVEASTAQARLVIGRLALRHTQELLDEHRDGVEAALAKACLGGSPVAPAAVRATSDAVSNPSRAHPPWLTALCEQSAVVPAGPAERFHSACLARARELVRERCEELYLEASQGLDRAADEGVPTDLAPLRRVLQESLSSPEAPLPAWLNGECSGRRLLSDDEELRFSDLWDDRVGALRDRFSVQLSEEMDSRLGRQFLQAELALRESRDRSLSTASRVPGSHRVQAVAAEPPHEAVRLAELGRLPTWRVDAVGLTAREWTEHATARARRSVAHAVVPPAAGVDVSLVAGVALSLCSLFALVVMTPTLSGTVLVVAILAALGGGLWVRARGLELEWVLRSRYANAFGALFSDGGAPTSIVEELASMAARSRSRRRWTSGARWLVTVLGSVGAIAELVSTAPIAIADVEASPRLADLAHWQCNEVGVSASCAAGALVLEGEALDAYFVSACTPAWSADCDSIVKRNDLFGVSEAALVNALSARCLHEGVAAACLEGGERSARTEAGFTNAQELYAHACALGAADACDRLLPSPGSEPASWSDAQWLGLESTCDSGAAEACLALVSGLDAEPARGDAMPVLKNACSLAGGELCAEAGRRLTAAGDVQAAGVLLAEACATSELDEAWRDDAGCKQLRRYWNRVDPGDAAVVLGPACVTGGGIACSAFGKLLHADSAAVWASGGRDVWTGCMDESAGPDLDLCFAVASAGLAEAALDEPATLRWQCQRGSESGCAALVQGAKDPQGMVDEGSLHWLQLRSLASDGDREAVLAVAGLVGEGAIELSRVKATVGFERILPALLEVEVTANRGEAEFSAVALAEANAITSCFLADGEPVFGAASVETLLRPNGESGGVFGSDSPTGQCLVGVVDALDLPAVETTEVVGFTFRLRSFESANAEPAGSFQWGRKD